jgi:tRNA G46 methylase TrmB
MERSSPSPLLRQRVPVPPGPGYKAHLATSWIGALEGVSEELAAGAKVADVGCGHGASTVVMAQAFPSSTFHGASG